MRNRYRRTLVAVRLAAWALTVGAAVAVLVVAVAGQREDPGAARALAERELRTVVLAPGERILAAADVAQRAWTDYYRATYGVLVATDRRVLFVGIPPRSLTPPPSADPPLAIVDRAYAYDSVTAEPALVFPRKMPGVALISRSGEDRFGAAGRGGWPALQRVLRTIEAEQATRRAMAEWERLEQLTSSETARQPIYHVVQRGEALSTIAVQYNITPERLRELNGLPSDRIKVGQRLLVKPRT